MKEYKDNKEEFYTPKDIQAILKIGKNKCYELISSDGFPSIRLGKKCIRIPVEDFNQWKGSYIAKKYVS